MAVIKAIIFDAGGVLLKGSEEHFLRCACKEFKLDRNLFGKDVEGKILGKEIQLGRGSSREGMRRFFLNKLNERQLDAALEFFWAEWNQVPEMIELAKKLRKQYKVALLSNTEHENIARHRKEGLLKLFDAVVLSNEVHLLKPGKEIFELMLGKLQLKAGQCVFVDDVLRNVRAARKLGMYAIHFKNREQLLQEFKKLGIAA